MGQRIAPMLLCCAAAIPAGAATAHAFTYGSAVSAPCHERITLAALAEAGWPDGATPPAPDRMTRALVEDVPAELPDNRKDGWTAGLVIGARDNDLHGERASDFQELAFVHADPRFQPEHCLRRPDDDGPGADAAALAACRAFILGELGLALGDADPLDLAATTPVDVTLLLRGRVTAPVSRYGFHAGRALHAFQDSFTHTYRSPDGDGHRVRAVLNFVDLVASPAFDTTRDGPAHLTKLDQCGDVPEQLLRFTRATTASIKLLRAINDPAGGRAGRLARAAAVLDVELAQVPGCGADNAWCGASEPAEPEGKALSCAVDRRARPSSVMILAAALLALALFVRRSKSILTTTLLRCSKRSSRLPILLPIALAITLAPVAARADYPPKAGPDARFPRKAFATAYGSFSIDRSAISGGLGARYSVLPWLTIGTDVAWNPWFSTDVVRVTPGVLNFHATAIFHLLRKDDLVLRTSLQVGGSVLLFDLIGADTGSVGPYFGFCLLGIAVRMKGGAWLVIDPGEVAIPMPNVKGYPFAYQQYRITVGVEWHP